MRATIWSNAGRHEWIIWADNAEEIVRRSGLKFRSRSAALTDLRKQEV
jgi:hypothetical protein